MIYVLMIDAKLDHPKAIDRQINSMLCYQWVIEGCQVSHMHVHSIDHQFQGLAAAAAANQNTNRYRRGRAMID
jgi:hypothetical protein